MSSSRKTIGLLTYGIWDALGESLWLGVHDAAIQHDVNLLTFEGWVLNDNSYRSASNILYDIVSSEVVDGLIILSGSVGQNLDDRQIKDFVSNYADLPMISIAAQIESVPSIIANNYNGMRLAVEHLIEVHDRKRIVFIRGPEQHPEANERYQAYRDSLEKYQIPSDPKLILQGDFRDQSAETGILNLINAGIAFDAVVAANDNMALGAMRALNNKNVSVPDDVSVVGFDDIPEARAAMPPLTSVSSSFNSYGRQSVAMLMSMMNGDMAPPVTSVDLDLAIRESCGCLAETIIQAGQIIDVTSKPMSLEEAAEPTQKAMVGVLKHYTTVSKDVNLVFQSFKQAVNNQSLSHFVRHFFQVLNSRHLDTEHLESWHNAISIMRSHLLPALTDRSDLLRAESMWGQARLLIGKAIISKNTAQQSQQNHLDHILRENGYELAMSFDTETLLVSSSNALLRLDVPNTVISLYEDPDAPLDQAELFLVQQGTKRQTSSEFFPSRQIVPPDLLPKNRQYSIVVNALYFDQVQLGLAAFEVGPRTGLVYDTLARQISHAIHGTNLVQKSRQYANALELAISHTLSSAEQIQSTANQNSSLAGEVAQAAQRSVEVSKSGQEAIQNTVTAMLSITQQVQSIVDHILALSSHTQSISDIILGVKEIGDQSKYLALNARIEAANAGSKGRGFSVVAHEMQNLARQSAESTSLVSENLSKIKAATNKAVHETIQGKTNVEQGMELVLQAGDTIHELASVIESAAQIAAEIAIATNTQSTNVEALVNAIRTLNQSKS